MIKIKICGLKNICDIELVNHYQPDYAGFVMAESKRQVSFEDLKALIMSLKPSIQPVGVFVNASLDNIEKSLECGVKVIQLHGNETQDDISSVLRLKHKHSFEIWKAIRVAEDIEQEAILEMKQLKGVDCFLLDKKTRQSYGGSGKCFCWDKLKNIGQFFPVILAGGLDSDNVLEGIDIIKPFGVDVSSGVESNHQKDQKKIATFMAKLNRG